MGKFSFLSSGTYETSDDDEMEMDTTQMHAHTRQTVLEIAGVLRSRCIQYAEEGSYDLCEFLDSDNVENFVNWLLYVR
jgi:hypothetical protein